METTIPLRDAFGQRNKRFLFLDRGLELSGLKSGSRLLEAGCADGAGTEHMLSLGFDITGIDIDPAAIEAAKGRSTEPGRYICADARCLPFETGSFDGIVSEAAFSVIPDKPAAAAEYARVLMPGGKLLLHDYYISSGEDAERSSVSGIPMLMGVQPAGVYRDIMEKAGLRLVTFSDEYAELIRIAMSLSRVYGIPASEVPAFLVKSFGANEFVSDFFSRARLSYCRMIFEKPDTLE